MSEIYSVMDQIDFWHWWILAAVFLAIEVFAPTTLFLWTGISAAVVGIVAYFADGLSWQIQFLLFAILSVASVFAWRAIARSRQSAEDEPLLNRRGMQYVDRQFTLEQPIIHGEGSLRIDDTIWKIAGDDCASGERVRVTGLDGHVLQVEKA
ncbi:MAG: NfeD family protein [Alphaproteobacteria bacterium]|nr:NfeD family protein [Alphaproteobacteria bacterium]